MAAPYGIDAIVQQRVDANRSNPGALANNYKQNQQLVDLLALQKLKQDKDAATRDIQMKMQGNPQTIMQQREQQVLDMTKQELAQRVGHAGENQERQMQQRMQGGIANVPAPNMQGMAEGGIVPRMGYSGGGTAAVAQRSVEDRAIELMRLSPELEFDVAYKIASQQASVPNKAALASGDAALARNSDMAAGGSPGAWDETNVQMMLGEDLQPRAPGMPAPGIAGATPTVFPDPTAGYGGGISAMLATGGGSPINVVDRTAPQISAPDNSALRTRNQGILDTKSDTVRDAAGERFRELTNVDDLLAQQQGVTDKRQAVYDKMNDPKRQKRDRLKAFLTGAANRTSLGSAMAGASAASTNLRNEQETTQVNQLNELRGEFEKMVAANRELGMAQSEAEDKAMDMLASQQNTAVQSETELNRQESQIAMEEVANKLTQAGLDQELAIETARLENELNRALISASGRGSGEGDDGNLTRENQIKVLEMVIEDPEYIAASAALATELGKEGMFTREGRARYAELKQEYVDLYTTFVDGLGQGITRVSP